MAGTWGGVFNPGASHNPFIAKLAEVRAALPQVEAEIVPYAVKSHVPGEGGTVRIVERKLAQDEGPRPDSAPDKLAKLKPAFGGSVTAATVALTLWARRGTRVEYVH